MFSDETGPDLEGSWSEERLWLEVGKPLHGPGGCDRYLSRKPSTRASQASVVPLASGPWPGKRDCQVSHIYSICSEFNDFVWCPLVSFFQDALNVLYLHFFFLVNNKNLVGRAIFYI